jgi:hypothetical protein
MPEITLIPTSMEQVRSALKNFPAALKLELERNIDKKLQAKTVGELCQLGVWPPNLRIIYNQEPDKMRVRIERT